MVASVKYEVDSEIVKLCFQSEIPASCGKIRLEYTGNLNDKMKGFYRSKYKNVSGEDKYHGVTMFAVCKD